MTPHPRPEYRAGDEREWFVTAERYLETVERFRGLFKTITPRPDSVVGIKRSGLFPAVFLSHVFALPMFTDGEAKVFPYPKFARPVVVDLAVWSGGSMRHTYGRLARSGVPRENITGLAAWICADPRPDVDRLHYLELTDRIMHFWYYEEETP
ncbi:hypothetical protein JW859_13635 [bacterium]|nr:hypothetical protein [bacterium]